MYVSVPSPKEVPSIKELMDKKPKKFLIKTKEDLWNTLKIEKKDNSYKSKKVEVKEDYKKPTLSLQWKRNFEAVIDRMKNHMKAYPETHKGFFAEFLDDKGNRWYNVELWKKGERWVEEIDWVYYRITPTIFIFSKNWVIVGEVNSPKENDQSRLENKNFRNTKK